MTFEDCSDGGHMNDPDREIIADGPASTVTRFEPDRTRFIAVKSSTTTHAKEPHDIVKEVRLISSLSHPNIIPLIKQQLCQRSNDLSFWMPYIPYSLDELLRSSRFSPHPIVSFGSTTSPSPTPREVRFDILAKSIIFQILCGVSYLHSERVQIAHRDVKPDNVLLTPSGRVQLIDFGIAFRVYEDGVAKAKDLWPESTARMYFEVSTGPYRAPELLFGPRTYDAFAIDAWSLGVTFAEFFTSLRLQTDQDEDHEDVSFLSSERTSESDPESGSESNVTPRAPAPPPTPFIIPQGIRTRPGVPTGSWTRTTLFDGRYGEIGLAWCIFKIRGTPNEVTWPSFLTLPDANKLSFVSVPAVDLSSLLPNLPPSTSNINAPLDTRTHAPSPSPFLDPLPDSSPDSESESESESESDAAFSSPLDLVHRFLVYEPARRMRPFQALAHPWFKAQPRLVLPADAEDDRVGYPSWLIGSVAHTVTLEGQTCTVGELLQGHFASRGLS